MSVQQAARQVLRGGQNGDPSFLEVMQEAACAIAAENSPGARAPLTGPLRGLSHEHNKFRTGMLNAMSDVSRAAPSGLKHRNNPQPA